jgi:sporulation protein YlmC with PRC-barrel domain
MSQSKHPTNTELEKLSDTRLTLGDSAQDIRNRKVLDRHGEEIGHVSDLFIDQNERKVQMLEIRAGGFLGLGDRHFLLPVSAITSISKGEVHVNQTREHIVGSPVYDPALIVAPTRQYWEPYYGYYGYLPYWGSGFMYPYFPISREAANANERSHHQGDPSQR